jgi:hypothetical protein
MNHRVPKTCEVCNKKILANEENAREHLGYILHKRMDPTKRGRWATVPYLCPYGNGWHVGRNHETLMINFKKGRTKNVGKRISQVQNRDRFTLQLQQRHYGMGAARKS